MKLTLRLKQAIDTAARAHDSKYRADGKTPYISHPFGISLQLAKYTEDEDVVIAGLFHDILEDVDPAVYSAKQIKEDFGPNVLNIVREVSDDPSIKGFTNKKQAYLDHLETASEDALMVSAADLMHNMLSEVSGYQKNGTFYRYYEESDHNTRWFWESRMAIIKKRLQNGLVADLEATYELFKQTTGK